MRKISRRKVISLLSALAATTTVVAPIAATLTSCSNTKTITPYSYTEKDIIEVRNQAIQQRTRFLSENADSGGYTAEYIDEDIETLSQDLDTMIANGKTTGASYSDLYAQVYNYTTSLGLSPINFNVYDYYFEDQITTLDKSLKSNASVSTATRESIIQKRRSMYASLKKEAKQKSLTAEEFRQEVNSVTTADSLEELEGSGYTNNYTANF